MLTNLLDDEQEVKLNPKIKLYVNPTKDSVGSKAGIADDTNESDSNSNNDSDPKENVTSENKTGIPDATDDSAIRHETDKQGDSIYTQTTTTTQELDDKRQEQSRFYTGLKEKKSNDSSKQNAPWLIAGPLLKRFPKMQTQVVTSTQTNRRITSSRSKRKEINRFFDNSKMNSNFKQSHFKFAKDYDRLRAQEAISEMTFKVVQRDSIRLLNAFQNEIKSRYRDMKVEISEEIINDPLDVFRLGFDSYIFEQKFNERIAYLDNLAIAYEKEIQTALNNPTYMQVRQYVSNRSAVFLKPGSYPPAWSLNFAEGEYVTLRIIEIKFENKVRLDNSDGSSPEIGR